MRGAGLANPLVGRYLEVFELVGMTGVDLG